MRRFFKTIMQKTSIFYHTHECVDPYHAVPSSNKKNDVTFSNAVPYYYASEAESPHPTLGSPLLC